MKVLFIGGTGIISSACSKLAVERGVDLYLLNRGQSARPAPEGAHLLRADARDRGMLAAALQGCTFDAVVNWIAFTPEHVETDIELFRGITGQYVFISSASAYQKPPASLPITESTPLRNPFWQYSQNKIACEERLNAAYRAEGFPVTIVRPSHTYDRTKLPLQGDFTMIERMRKGKPVVVHGDGTSLWVMTHHEDFARAFLGLLANQHAIGQAYHITSDEMLTWNQIYETLGRAAGVTAPQLVHVPSDLINAWDPIWGPGLIGDKANSVIFDNTKIKRAVPGWEATIPFARGAEEMIAWHDADPARRRVDEKFDAMLDRMIEAYRESWPRG